MTVDKKQVKENALKKETINKARIRLRNRIFREIRNAFRQYQTVFGMSQSSIADKLGVDKGLISKRLRGEENLTLNTISDMFLAMDARLEVKAVSFQEIREQIYNNEIKTFKATIFPHCLEESEGGKSSWLKEIKKFDVVDRETIKKVICVETSDYNDKRKTFTNIEHGETAIPSSHAPILIVNPLKKITEAVN